MRMRVPETKNFCPQTLSRISYQYYSGMGNVAEKYIKKTCKFGNPFSILGRPLFLLDSSLVTHKKDILLLILPYKNWTFLSFLLVRQSQFWFGPRKWRRIRITGTGCGCKVHRFNLYLWRYPSRLGKLEFVMRISIVSQLSKFTSEAWKSPFMIGTLQMLSIIPNLTSFCDLARFIFTVFLKNCTVYFHITAKKSLHSNADEPQIQNPGAAAHRYRPRAYLWI